jgi:hypothetical protein
MELAGCSGFVRGENAYNSTSKCCFRTADKLDRCCDTMLCGYLGCYKKCEVEQRRSLGNSARCLELTRSGTPAAI